MRAPGKLNETLQSRLPEAIAGYGLILVGGVVAARCGYGQARVSSSRGNFGIARAAARLPRRGRHAKFSRNFPPSARLMQSTTRAWRNCPHSRSWGTVASSCVFSFGGRRKEGDQRSQVVCEGRRNWAGVGCAFLIM